MDQPITTNFLRLIHFKIKFKIKAYAYKISNFAWSYVSRNNMIITDIKLIHVSIHL